MTRNLLILAIPTAIAACLLPPQIHGQAKPEPKPRLAFEVASIKLHEAGAPGGGIRPLPGGQRYTATGVPVRLIMKLMYHIMDDQISGGPGWMDTERYDIEAKAEHPSSLDDLHVMFQNLLADRFQLRFHSETKQLSEYALTVDKGGSKMKVNENTPEFADIPIKMTMGSTLPTMNGQRVLMSYLAWNLAQMLEHPVVDETGLKGYYDFKLEFAPEPRGPGRDGGPAGPIFDGPNIFNALREQLGLKLEARKGPVEVFVIDHIERPSAN